MNISLKPYPRMKDSGVPWLGEVPEHWRLRRTKTVLRERVQKGFPDEPLLAATQTKGVVRKDQYENRTVLALKDLHLLKLVRVGDFVISLRSFQGGIEYAREQGIISPAYTILYPAQQETHRFLAWLFKSKPYIENLSLYVTGIRQGQNIDYEKLSRSALPLPPSDEQTAIMRFLDHAERKIRRSIRAKQKLIKLLEEQKQAIIHRAVTRGLDPEVRLKPSGVEWLGDIPEHWEVISLKHVLRRLVDCEHKTAPAVDNSEFRVVRTSAVRHGCLRWKGTYCTTEEAFNQWTQRATPLPGDVIFTREAPAGEACVVPEGKQVCLGQRTVLLKVRQDKIDPHFLVHMIYAGPPRDRIRLATQGSTVGHFNMDDIGWMHILRPPLAEQHLILGEIRQRTNGLSQASTRAENEITLLREYRTRLIADVVTGKLDVRGADIPGITEEEPPALDDDVPDTEDMRDEMTEAEE